MSHDIPFPVLRHKFPYGCGTKEFTLYKISVYFIFMHSVDCGSMISFFLLFMFHALKYRPTVELEEKCNSMSCLI